MAFIALKVPSETARLLEELYIPIKRSKKDLESASDMHVTIMYLGKKLAIGNIAKAMCSAFTVASITSPIECYIDTISSFDTGRQKPIIAPVVSPGLFSLYDTLKSAFDIGMVDYDDKFPEYKPHVTLAHANVDHFNDVKFPKLSWTSYEMVIYGSDQGFGKVAVHLPFVIDPMVRMAVRLVG
jgi:2'-5' RNA ligase